MGGVIPGGEMPITTAPFDQTGTSISGDIIVYTEFGGYADILYYDLASHSEHRVDTMEGNQFVADVSNGVIVYDDAETGTVWVYYVASGTPIQIAGPPATSNYAMNPSIGGSLVAWQGYGYNTESSYDIYARDLASGEVRLVAGSTDIEMNPAVAGGIIVYNVFDKYPAPQYGDIYAYDWSSTSTLTIEDDPSIDARDPDTDGIAVVYSGQDLGTGLKDIYYFNLVTGNEKRLMLPGNQLRPKISGDYVSFEDITAEGLFHIRLWHVPTGAVFDLNVPVTFGQYFCDIDGRRVVYAEDHLGLGQLDIYMYAFETPTYTITATAGTGGSITPSGGATVSIGEDQGFTVTPDTGYHILDVVVDGVSQGALSAYTFTSVVEDHAIAASFACGDIEVVPTTVQFGDVTVGASATQIVTIQNVGAAGLTVTGISLAPGSSGFAVTSAPSTPLTLAPGATAYVSVAFTPAAAGAASGALRVTSDDPDEGLVEAALSGTGVSGETPPSEQLAGILTFFDESVADGTLAGSGPGNSAKGRLGALRNMLEAAGDLIDEGRIDEATQQLQAAYLHVDGQPRPPDVVTGPAATELAIMIQQLISSLGG
jgi:beta propeller repeat protein